MGKRMWSWVLASCLLAACGSQVRNPVTGQQERSVMDPQAEIALGRREHAAILKDTPAYANDRVQAYVNALGQRLARLSHRSDLEWHFTVLDSPEINAFALPGGYVYVTRGIMAYLDSEAELAGVMGHEIGHVTARHGAQRATRQQDAGLGVLAASVLGAVLDSRGLSGAGRAVAEVSQVAAAGYVASYGREQELQADGLGAEYLSRSQYDPQTMVRVIGVLKSQEQFAADQARAQGRPVPAPNNWLASHPSNDQRLQAITRLAAQYRGQGGDPGRERYLDVLDGLHFGERASQGLTRGRHFLHAALDLALTAPPQWAIQNLADRVLLVNPARDAALVVRLVPPQLGLDHDTILRQGFQPQSGRVERKTVNGQSATQFTGVRLNAQGQPEPLVATIVSGAANRRFALVWSARDGAALQRARAQLQQAQDTFRPMSAADHELARPWVLRTTALPAGGWAPLAGRSPLEAAEAQLRLINGVYGGGELRPGQRVKVVEPSAAP
ncbi:MAG: M48 family metalloprotease [Rhodoferax sp.]|jgi:predicted Zn-dependent protease|nr:M48 family metalloprotease [Rhodoferax sp.]